MDTKKKAIIVSAILIGLGGYYIYMNMKPKSSVAEETDGKDESTFDVTKVLSNPLVGSDAHVHAAKFAILWRLKNVGSFESPQRQIFDEVAPKP